METNRKPNGDLWKARVETQARSGLTHGAFCTNEGIAVSALRYWKKRLARESAGGSNFVEITPGGCVQTGVGASTRVVRFVLSTGVGIEVSVGTDLLLLARVVAALERSR